MVRWWLRFWVWRRRWMLIRRTRRGAHRTASLFRHDARRNQGDARGGTLGFPTAIISADPVLLMPLHGIYAGFAAGHKAAISIGTNPHYGGEELRIEAFLLGFAGDLYGRRLVVELWQRLRDEQVFASEHELIDQIARDVEATQQAERPSLGSHPGGSDPTG